MNLSVYARHVLFSIGLAGLRLELDLVSGWLVVMHTYLYYTHCPGATTGAHVLATRGLVSPSNWQF